MSGERSDLLEVHSAIFGSPFDVRAVWATLRGVLASPERTVEQPSPFPLPPMRFALALSLLLPFTVVAALSLVSAMVAERPPSVFDQTYDVLAELRAEWRGTVPAESPGRGDDAERQAYARTYLMPMLLLGMGTVDDAERARLRDEVRDAYRRDCTRLGPAGCARTAYRLDRQARSDQGKMRFLDRYTDSGADKLVNALLVGGLLLLSGRFFRWRVRKLGGVLPAADRADRAFLYLVTARTFWLSMAGLLTQVLMVFGIWYHVASLATLGFGAQFLLIPLMMLLYWRCAPMLTQALGGDRNDRALVRRLAWRSMQVFVVILVGSMVFGAVFGVAMAVLGGLLAG